MVRTKQFSQSKSKNCFIQYHEFICKLGECHKLTYTIAPHGKKRSTVRTAGSLKTRVRRCRGFSNSQTLSYYGNSAILFKENENKA